MKIKVIAFGPLKEALGAKKIEVDLRDSPRVIDLLLHLSEKFGKNFSERVFDLSGKDLVLAPNVKVFVNGRDVDFLDGLNTKLNENDDVYLIPPAGGG